jgi:UDP-N-acetylglucosamine 1-carboxyvinyltransferase
MAAAALTGSDICINDVFPGHLETALQKFEEAGVEFEYSCENSVRVKGPERLKSVDISTSPYPGFPTDMQAQFMAMMTVAEGSSVIEENIFEGRFMHVAELRRMGAVINQKGSVCTVKGVKELRGAPVMATDLRASACLVIAGLAAQGDTEIRRIYHLDRGYEKLEHKLNRLGASVERVKE